MAPRPVVVGTGPRHVLALHGGLGSAAGWGPCAELLDGDRYSVAFVDYRGYGTRRGEPGSFSLAEIAAAALADDDVLGWPDLAVRGHSKGGSAMQRVLAGPAGRVRALLGISPVPSTGVPFDDQ